MTFFSHRERNGVRHFEGWTICFQSSKEKWGTGTYVDTGTGTYVDLQLLKNRLHGFDLV